MKNCKTAALAASIALALGSTAAYAAAPAATQLPGQGKVAAGGTPTVTTGGTASAPTLTIGLGGNTVIDWGNGGTDINKTGTAGFNVGSAATVTFTGGNVLNVDVSGNASQIFGALSNSGGNLYVANTNGVIVGAGATVSASGEVGLIGNKLGSGTFAGNITDVGYDGTGGNVSVATGADVSGATVLISGGGTVNVDLSALTGGAATLMAGTPNAGGSFATSNPNASLAVTSALGGATLAGFTSAGNASSSGTLTLGSNAAVEGTLTNTGTLTLGGGFDIDGALVNNKTVTQTGTAEADGGVTNAGAWTGGGFALIAGGLTNNAQMTNMGYVEMDGGDFVNNGQFTGNGSNINTYGGGNFTNNGVLTGVGYVDIYEGGDFNNVGSMTLNTAVYVLNGNISNSGKLTVSGWLETASDDTAPGFTKGADYSITNSGTVTSTNSWLQLGANSDDWSDHKGTSANDSTGSISNTGILQVATGYGLQLDAHDNVSLGGSVQSNGSGKYAALSATNPLGYFEVYAGDYDGSVLNTAGTATLSTDIFTSGSASVAGNQVELMGNLSSVDSTGAPVGAVNVVAGAAPDSGYSVRVAAGKTVTADDIYVDGDQAGDNPNMILQGTLSAGTGLYFGNSVAVGDVFNGPAGSVDVGSDLSINSVGRVKTAPYLNDANNFRYNYLPVTVTGGGPLNLTINADSLQGTPTSGYNLLVNGDVNFTSTWSGASPIYGTGTAVTGVVNVPNSHMVLQSTGNIATTGDTYWPGYIYLGNIAMDSDGNALPGTLGLGTITLGGNFSNVLPGDIAGASGIHFITQFPMNLGAYTVTTNANAWVNFGTDTLTQAYSSGTLGGGQFFGGSQGAGSVINYGPLPASSFVTQPPVSDR